MIADTRAIIAARPDVLLATTAYGVRRWFEVADAAGLGEDLLDALADTAILVRGPKARGGIRAAGLNDVGMSAEETTESLIDEVLATRPPGLTVAVQLHGFLNPSQLDRLRDAHDRVLTVEPYRWIETDEADDRVDRLIDAVCSGGLDCITFTSAPAVHALFSAAEARGRYEDLVDAMCGPVVAAAVGPVTAAPLVAAGITPIQPERYRMGALIRLVCEHLESTRVIRLDTRHGPLALRGSVVDVDHRRVALAPVALMILRALVQARGSVVGPRAPRVRPPGNERRARPRGRPQPPATDPRSAGTHRHRRQAGVPDRCLTTTSHDRPSRVSRWRRRVYDRTDPRKHAAHSVGFTSSTP